MNCVKVPRWLGPHPTVQFRELHGFADASEKAYAAVIYLRTVDARGEVRTQLLTAKTKVAPLHRVTLPHLELYAATLLSRLMAWTRETLELEGVAAHLWSDSTVTLDWIRGHPSRWKTYVANRVSEIQLAAPDAYWHHVSGQDNPADCASRGLPPRQLPAYTLWWKGPDWLTGDPHWNTPTPRTGELTELEARSSVHGTTCEEPASGEYLLTRYSSLSKLLRVTAWCRRWRHPRRPRPEGRSGLPSSSDTNFLKPFDD